MRARFPGFLLVCASVSLVLASCGGGESSTSSSQTPAVSSVDAVPPGSTIPGLIAQWDSAQYVERLEQNRYGDPEASILRQDDSAVIFEPKTARDHVSTPFVSVAGGASSLELVLQAASPEGDACIATLQDQNFQVLTTLPCAGSGERKATAAVTGDVTAVRVYFMSDQMQPQQLPQRIRIIVGDKG